MSASFSTEVGTGDAQMGTILATADQAPHHLDWPDIAKAGGQLPDANERIWHILAEVGVAG